MTGRPNGFPNRVVAPLIGAMFFLVLCFPALAQEGQTGMTPSDVHQHARWVIAEIELIREHEGVTATPRDPGTQINKLPIHVYQKAVELMDKVARYQEELGLEPMVIARLPFEALIPEVVFEPVDAVLRNLRTVKARLGVTSAAPQPEFYAGRMPTQVYELLWRASYMMDGLTRPLESSDVYAKQQQVVADLQVVAEALGVSIPLDRSTFEDKGPRDVLMENYVNMYRLARLQRRLGMEPFYVPPLPGGEITPANVYDTGGTLIGELHRIKVALGIEVPTPPLSRVDEKTPDDVYAETKLVQAGLDMLLETVPQR